MYNISLYISFSYFIIATYGLIKTTGCPTRATEPQSATQTGPKPNMRPNLITSHSAGYKLSSLVGRSALLVFTYLIICFYYNKVQNVYLTFKFFAY